MTLAVVLCMTVFSVTAYAGGGDMVDSTMGDPTMETQLQPHSRRIRIPVSRPQTDRP